MLVENTDFGVGQGAFGERGGDLLNDFTTLINVGLPGLVEDILGDLLAYRSRVRLMRAKRWT